MILSSTLTWRKGQDIVSRFDDILQEAGQHHFTLRASRCIGPAVSDTEKPAGPGQTRMIFGVHQPKSINLNVSRVLELVVQCLNQRLI
jgi:hypothetical protein